MTDKLRISRRRMLKLSAAAGAALVGTGMGVRLGRAQDGTEEVALPQVPRRVLGKTGAHVPILLMGGSMKLDQRFDPKLAECLRFGVNYFDAADCYAGGACEPAIGSFHERLGNRKDIWITSKSDKHDTKGFEQTVHESLEKLQTDFIDMYFLHALQEESYLSPEMQAVAERLKKEGKIKYFGFSCHDGNVAELLEKAAEVGWVDAVMFRYNFRKYGDQKLNKAMDACTKANVGLIAMKTQSSEASFADAWAKFEQTGKWNKHQAVLKAVWADERIAAAVSHMDTFEKLKQNIGAATDNQDLGQAEIRAIEEYAAATRAYACDGCDHICNPAVEAPVKIGATMRYLMYHDVYGDKSEAKSRFRALPPEAQRLSGVDFSAATRACPHGVDVAAHMKRAAEVFHA